jgi:DnaK suppressor protein
VKKSLQTTKKANSRWQAVAKIETSLSQQKKESVARSSASELSLAQLKQLKLKLSEIRDELTRSVELKTQAVINHAYVLENTLQGDDAEVAEKQRLSNANLQELDFLKSRLQLIDRALLKMKEGCYGICEETEEPIGFERLQVVPWARFSIKVQEKREIRSRDFGRIQRAE